MELDWPVHHHRGGDFVMGKSASIKVPAAKAKAKVPQKKAKQEK